MRKIDHRLLPEPPPEVFYNQKNPIQIFDIRHVQPNHSETPLEEFKGACLDIGAQKSVIGYPQAKSYSSFSGYHLRFFKSNHAFRFGDGCYPSIGNIPVRIPTPHNSFIHTLIDIVQANVPFLFGLDLLDGEKLVADNVRNQVISRRHNWTIPITRKEGHLYVVWNFSSILFTKTELQRYHFFSTILLRKKFSV